MPFPYNIIGVGKRHCRVLPAIAMTFRPARSYDYFEVGKRHCRVRLAITPIKETGFFIESVELTKYYREKPGFWVPVLSPSFKKVLH